MRRRCARHVVRGEDPALGDQQGADGAEDGEAFGHGQIDLEGPQRAVVDADQIAAQLAGAGHFGLVVGLDQGVHAETLRLGQQVGGEGVVDHGEDDQDAVGAQRAALGHLPGIDEEILAQAGQGDGVAGGGEEGVVALEAGPVGKNRQTLGAAREATALPCLRKDFLVDPWQVAESRALGADCILIILAMIDDALATDLLSEARRFGMDALIETHDEAEMARACALGGDLVGINNRSLRTFEVDLEVTERLAMLSPVRALLVAESGIFTPDDVARVSAAHAQAVLVGESLMRQADVEAATRALMA